MKLLIYFESLYQLHLIGYCVKKGILHFSYIKIENSSQNISPIQKGGVQKTACLLERQDEALA